MVIVPFVCLSGHPCGHCAIHVPIVSPLSSLCCPEVVVGASMFWEDVIESGRRGVGMDNWRVGGRACVGMGMDILCGCGCTVWAKERNKVDCCSTHL